MNVERTRGAPDFDRHHVVLYSYRKKTVESAKLYLLNQIGQS